ncbi:hypothetical protein BD410DRAFT_453142 [Rickenella mellea]|uniref:Uncharacterized protein n=1 Tax=Rickenella mellea TaxID=50990 RepID=A0A4Y7PV42_9AGAM|nr:hypothetical protein BD410DRAFT_453142 [Rickenella mellea]
MHAVSTLSHRSFLGSVSGSRGCIERTEIIILCLNLASFSNARLSDKRRTPNHTSHSFNLSSTPQHHIEFAYQRTQVRHMPLGILPGAWRWLANRVGRASLRSGATTNEVSTNVRDATLYFAEFALTSAECIDPLRVLKNIVFLAQRVKQNRELCRRLISRVEESIGVLQSISDKRGTAHCLEGPSQHYFQTLLTIEHDLREISNQRKTILVFKQRNFSNSLESILERLDDAWRIYMESLAVNLQNSLSDLMDGQHKQLAVTKKLTFMVFL